MSLMAGRFLLLVSPCFGRLLILQPFSVTVISLHSLNLNCKNDVINLSPSTTTLNGILYTFMNANQGDKDRESHFVYNGREQKTKIGKKQENQRPFRCKNTQVSCNEHNQCRLC